MVSVALDTTRQELILGRENVTVKDGQELNQMKEVYAALLKNVL